jgi:trimethylamine:corrinoid methyltransferase-like protein
MRGRAAGWLVAGLAMVSGGALASNLSTSLKNFYAEYEVVKQCAEEAQLTATDAELAKAAIAKIEAHYLGRDASIDKDRVLKAAIADKNDGFRIATRGAKSDLRPYCRVSLKELLAKAEELDASIKP